MYKRIQTIGSYRCLNQVALRDIYCGGIAGGVPFAFFLRVVKHLLHENITDCPLIIRKHFLNPHFNDD